MTNEEIARLIFTLNSQIEEGSLIIQRIAEILKTFDERLKLLEDKQDGN